MFDKRLVLLLIVCVVFMVWLGVEGFAAYRKTPQQMLSLKYGLGKVVGNEFEVVKTASDFPNEAAYRSASIWQAMNMSDKENIYRELMEGKITEEDIRKMDRDPETRDRTRGAAKWLSYFDATDYRADSPDLVRTSSGSYYERRTGSRLNDTSYIDSQYFEEDSQGGRQLMQCAADDFACIRLLSYADPGYQPIQSDGSWQSQFGGGGSTPAPTNATAQEAAIRAAQVLAQQMQQQQQTAAAGPVAPAAAPGSASIAAGAPSATPNTDIAKCLIDTAALITTNFPTITDSNQKLSLARAVCTGTPS
jgi:hypothetical protein